MKRRRNFCGNLLHDKASAAYLRLEAVRTRSVSLNETNNWITDKNRCRLFGCIFRGAFSRSQWPAARSPVFVVAISCFQPVSDILHSLASPVNPLQRCWNSSVRVELVSIEYLLVLEISCAHGAAKKHPSVSIRLWTVACTECFANFASTLARLFCSMWEQSFLIDNFIIFVTLVFDFNNYFVWICRLKSY